MKKEGRREESWERERNEEEREGREGKGGRKGAKNQLGSPMKFHGLTEAVTLEAE